MGLPQRDTSRHTYADYLIWPDEVRYELIDGIAYAMGPAPLRIHQRVLLQLARQVADALEGKTCEAYIAPFDVRLPQAVEADAAVDTVVQPDLSVICDPAKLDERGCRGAPDWVVEVLSSATAGHDQVRKRALYERAGVREYWLVHPADRVVTIYCHTGEGFGPARVVEAEGTLAASILPWVVIDWARVFQGLPQTSSTGERERY